MSKEIKLSRGKVAVVDDADYEWISQWKWSCTTNGYAVRRVSKTATIVYLHRQIMDAPADTFVDHINHDALDNRRSNLRLATPTESVRNTRARKAESPFKGVLREQNRWLARIQVHGQGQTLGRFLTQREAAATYNEAAQRLFGEFAYLNDLSILPPEQDLPLFQRKPKSSFRGVSWHPQTRKWRTMIMVDYRKISLGLFAEEEDAAKAYDSFVKEHGLNRPLNFPTSS